MIYYFPLEKIDRRYTQAMRQEVENILSQVSEYCVIEGGQISDNLNSSDFLNPANTIYFKAAQIQNISSFFESKKIKNGDVFLFDDIWMPGIHSIRYMAGMLGLKNIKLFGFLHAGSHTPTDDVSTKLEQTWVKPFEVSVLNSMNGIFVGSLFHKTELIRQCAINSDKIYVTGIPCGVTNLLSNKKVSWSKRKDTVVFPCRLHSEKQPDKFRELSEIVRKQNHQIEFVMTHNLNLTKQDYYSLLSRSKLVISFALQENFGISILEAVFLGCNILVPNRLTYPEFFPSVCLYNCFTEQNLLLLADKLIQNLKASQNINTDNLCTQLQKKLNLIGNILKEAL